MTKPPRRDRVNSVSHAGVPSFQGMNGENFMIKISSRSYWEVLFFVEWLYHLTFKCIEAETPA